MTTSQTAAISITIAASPETVWRALTDPAIIKQYAMGADMITDWKEGSSIVFRGSWEGNVFESHGTVDEVQRNRLLRTSYVDGNADEKHRAATRQEVYYILDPAGKDTRLSVVQTRNGDDAGRKQAEQNWAYSLDILKKLAEA